MKLKRGKLKMYKGKCWDEQRAWWEGHYDCIYYLVWEQVPRGAVWWRGGKRKESLQLRLWNLNVCIEKVYAKCSWLAEMTLVMRHYPWHVFFNVCLHSRSFPLCADWRKFDSSVDEEPQGNWRWNSNSRDVVSSSPSSFPRRRQSAPESLLTG